MKVPTTLPPGNTLRREVDGWIVYVRASYIRPTLFAVRARKGSNVLRLDKLTHAEVINFDPNKEWSQWTWAQ